MTGRFRYIHNHLARRLGGMSRVSAGLVAGLAMVTLAGASAAAAPRPGGVAITTSPGLYPAFDPAVSDYVTRCTGNPIRVAVSVVVGTSVTVDGRGPYAGRFERNVSLGPGQAFSFETSRGDVQRTYHVRCLPPDFPQWTFERTGRPREEFYAVTPSIGMGGSHYVIIFDAHGVPIWWFKTQILPSDVKLLDDGTIAWAVTDESGYEIHRLDGTLTRIVSAVGDPTDPHDMQELGNGNFLVLAYKPRDNVDLSTPPIWCCLDQALGGPTAATVLDAEIQEIDPQGKVVWSWNSKDHIALQETGRWWPFIGVPADLLHFNSVEPDGGSLIISMRHADAVYKINRATGDIEWKLGGTPTPESLRVRNDPFGALPLAGQHDARVEPGGYLTVFDNGTFSGRAPRAVRYKIDARRRTATLVDSITDPYAPVSIWAGGARRYPSGSWLVSWGHNLLVGEYAADGSPTFRLGFIPGVSSYRAFPIAYGRLRRAALRAGLSAMYPR